MSKHVSGGGACDVAKVTIILMYVENKIILDKFTHPET